MPCPLCETLARVRNGVATAAVVADLDLTVVLLGENQGCPGWCVAVLKEHVEHLAHMPIVRQAAVFAEVARTAAAIRSVFGPVRINYECLGNQVAHVHWHVIPRHADDPQPSQPVWGWPSERLRGDMDPAARADLADRIARFMRAPGSCLDASIPGSSDDGT
ncbi:MAG: HIT family protein [Phycisphaeraceae bacterium]|nr:HIT family protein [Phycisphaerae bacterium]MBX3392122.1 HIT family protein [Phycisphaeraceae bacterium]